MVHIIMLLIPVDFENGKVDGYIRLADGGPNYGRLEIAVDGYWGTVCSTNFDMAAADVACKQLGFNESLTITRKLVKLSIAIVTLRLSANKPQTNI